MAAWHSGKGESQWVGRLGFDSHTVLKLSAAYWPFCMALSQSVHWHARFLYCCAACALYNFLFLGFRQWRSRADRVLILKMNIQLPLFWSTGGTSRAWGPNSATCASLADGRNYSDCRASEEMSKKCLAHKFLKILKNKGLLRPTQPYCEGFSNPHSPDWAHTSYFVQTWNPGILQLLTL